MQVEGGNDLPIAGFLANAYPAQPSAIKFGERPPRTLEVAMGDMRFQIRSRERAALDIVSLNVAHLLYAGYEPSPAAEHATSQILVAGRQDRGAPRAESHHRPDRAGKAIDRAAHVAGFHSAGAENLRRPEAAGGRFIGSGS